MGDVRRRWAWVLWFFDNGWLLGAGGMRTYAFGRPEFVPSIVAEYKKHRWNVEMSSPLSRLLNVSRKRRI